MSEEEKPKKPRTSVTQTSFEMRIPKIVVKHSTNRKSDSSKKRKKK